MGGGEKNSRFGPSVELAGYVDLRQKRLFFMKRRMYAQLVGTTLELHTSKDQAQKGAAAAAAAANTGGGTVPASATNATANNSRGASRTASRGGRTSSRARTVSSGSGLGLHPAEKVKRIELDGAKIESSKGGLSIQPRNTRRKFYIACDSEEQVKDWAAKLRRVSTNELESFYKLGKVIGVGSYGEVRIATDLITNEQVAVKTVQRSKFASEKEMEFVKREIDVMKNLRHPHIIRTHNIFDSGAKVHFVMEYLPGGDLFDAIAEENNFSEQNAAQIIKDILDAVQYLHRNNICHRDLKPENILCVERKWPLQVKLTDFGTAFDSSNAPAGAGGGGGGAHSVGSSNSSVMSTYVGTPYYMAPEQMRNEPYSFPVDVWACGIILFAMLAGRLPWEAPSEFEYCRAVQSKQLDFPEAQWKDISEQAKDMIRGMLALDPKKRLTAEQALDHQWLEPSSAPIRRINTDRSLLTSMGGRQWAGMGGVAMEDAANEKQRKLAQIRADDADDDLKALMGNKGKPGEPRKSEDESDDSAAEELHVSANWKHDQEVLDILNEAKSLDDLGDHVQEVVIGGKKGNGSDSE